MKQRWRCGLRRVILERWLVLVLMVVICGPAWVLAQDYVVGEADVLTISVYDNPDLTTEARVSTEGTITMPLIGQVQVAGLSVTDVNRKITRMYAAGYLVYPQVSVFVKDYRSSKATILGEVKQPGLHELQGHISFLEVVSKAGGFTDKVGNVAVVKRQEISGRPGSVIAIDLKKLVEQGDLSQDIAIQNGDRIYVKKAAIVYVSGQVKKPDAYKIEQGTTVIKAITLAGGLTDKASSRGITIVRKINGREEIYDSVRMDEPVEPEDVIVVPESFF